MTLYPFPILLPAIFRMRRNRFVADVEVAGTPALAHVPTSSRMGELLVPGVPVWVAPQPGAHRATAFDLQLVEYHGTLVSIDSRVPNRLLVRALGDGTVPEFDGWSLDRWEVRLGESRVDFRLVREERPCWIEAKSVSLVCDAVALFPDAPTARGVRHLGELATACAAGDRAAAFFVIQRGDAHAFAPHRALDPLFATALVAAQAAGVELVAYTTTITPQGIALARRVPVVLA
jgi:sugar fermentation stimulation protein A